jgi:hypothetical protein
MAQFIHIVQLTLGNTKTGEAGDETWVCSYSFVQFWILFDSHSLHVIVISFSFSHHSHCSLNSIVSFTSSLVGLSFSLSRSRYCPKALLSWMLMRILFHNVKVAKKKTSTRKEKKATRVMLRKLVDRIMVLDVQVLILLILLVLILLFYLILILLIRVIRVILVHLILILLIRLILVLLVVLVPHSLLFQGNGARALATKVQTELIAVRLLWIWTNQKFHFDQTNDLFWALSSNVFLAFDSGGDLSVPQLGVVAAQS